MIRTWWLLLLAVAMPACAASEAPAQEPEATPDWTSCYSDYDASGNPSTDLARLTERCGSLGGMRPITPVTRGQQRGNAGAARYTFPVKRRACFRVFAVGDRSVHDLDLALRGERGVVADLTHDRWPVLPPHGPLCLDPGLYMLEVSVFRGHGHYAMQVWGTAPQ